MRPIAKSLHKVEVRSRNQTSFWYDCWSDLGPLADLVGPRAFVDLGIRQHSTMVDAVFYRRRRRHKNELYSIIEDAVADVGERVVTGEVSDVHMWRRSADGFSSSFIAAQTWQLIRSVSNKVSWSKFVWFPQNTPKNAFFFWMLCNDSLQTLEKMKRWNAAISVQCCLCLNATETRNHLFMECEFSAGIWKQLMGIALGTAFTTRLWELARLILGEQVKIRRFVQLYCLQAAAYTIWSERNSRRHGSIPRSVDVLVRIVDRQMRNRLSSLQEEGLLRYQQGLEYWFTIFSNA